ncbi:sodium:solute symporter [Nanoarchaeota archaeon]
MVSAVDASLIVAYFVAITVIGYISRKKAGKEDFLLANRNLGVWHNLATITATKITTSVIITYVALVYMFGISAIWAYIGTVLGYIMFYFFGKRLKWESAKYRYYTLADYFYRRYGNTAGKMAGLIVFASFFFNFTIQLIGGAMVIEQLLGISFVLSAVFMAGVILFYLFVGGFKAVVKTDVVQVIAILVLFFGLGAMFFTNFHYDPVQWQIMSAGPQMIIPLLIIGMLFPFSAADLWQRAYAAKSVRTFKKSFAIGAVIYMLFGLLITVIGIIVKYNLPGIEAESAMIQGFFQLLPSGMVGLGVVALFAAIMSTADSYAFISASVLVQDFLFRGRMKHIVVRQLKYALVVVVGLGTLCAVMFNSLIDAVYLLSGMFMVMSVVVMATWIRRRIRALTVNMAFSVGVGLTLAFAFVKGISATVIAIGLVAALLGLGIGAVVSKVRG